MLDIRAAFKTNTFIYYPILPIVNRGDFMPEGRCMKCKKQVQIKDPKEIIIKGKAKMKAVKGECPKCGTKVYRIVGKA